MATSRNSSFSSPSLDAELTEGVSAEPSYGPPTAPEICPECGLTFDPLDLEQVFSHLHDPTSFLK
jgi:hypothetical protein